MAWNLGQAHFLSTMDETSSSINKFASLTAAENSGITSQGQLLTLWSEQVPPALEPFVGQGSPLISGFWRKTQPLGCAALEAQEHTIQLLEALGTIL